MFDNIDLEEIIGKHIKEKSTKELLLSENNIYVKCKITKEEALTGCNKEVENKDIEEKKYNKITVKIPPKIKDGNIIIVRNSGSITRKNKEEGNLIVEIVIKNV